MFTKLSHKSQACLKITIINTDLFYTQKNRVHGWLHVNNQYSILRELPYLILSVIRISIQYEIISLWTFFFLYSTRQAEKQPHKSYQSCKCVYISLCFWLDILFWHLVFKFAYFVPNPNPSCKCKVLIWNCVVVSRWKNWWNLYCMTSSRSCLLCMVCTSFLNKHKAGNL